MHLFFDFDGTLADSSPGIYASFQLACQRLNLSPPAFDVFRDAIGPPVQQLVTRFFPDLTANKISEFRLLFRADYDNSSFRRCDWYEGLKPTLTYLSTLPYTRLSIVTNKPTRPTLDLLKSGGLLGFFDLVVGVDYQVYQGTGSVFDSKADAIRLATTRLANEAVPAFYIGDTPSDRDASQACGLDFIAAMYGFHRWQPSEVTALPTILAIIDLIPLLNKLTGVSAEPLWSSASHPT